MFFLVSYVTVLEAFAISVMGRFLSFFFFNQILQSAGMLRPKYLQHYSERHLTILKRVFRLAFKRLIGQCLGSYTILLFKSTALIVCNTNTRTAYLQHYVCNGIRAS